METIVLNRITGKRRGDRKTNPNGHPQKVY